MDYIKEFLEDCKARGLSPHCQETYRSNIKAYLRAYPDPKEVNLENLKSFLIDLRSRGLCGSTLKCYFAVISSFYDYLIFCGAIQSNPIPPFRRRYLRIKNQYNGENTRQIITTEQMSQLINLAKKDNDILGKTLMLFLAKTGIRRGELISMDVQDVDLEKGEFRVKPKAKRTNRLSFLDSELTAALREYLYWRQNIVNVHNMNNVHENEKENALWISAGGKRISRNYVYNTVVDYAIRAGLHDKDGPINKKYTPHCFRHFFTTMLRRNGMQREFIQELRGDRRKDAMDIYDHIDVEELKKAYLKCIPYFDTE